MSIVFIMVACAACATIGDAIEDYRERQKLPRFARGGRRRAD